MSRSFGGVAPVHGAAIHRDVPSNGGDYYLPHLPRRVNHARDSVHHAGRSMESRGRLSETMQRNLRAHGADGREWSAYQQRETPIARIADRGGLINAAGGLAVPDDPAVLFDHMGEIGKASD